MRRIAIKPVWTLQDAEGAPLPPRLIELLVQVQRHGSLLAACQQMGLSYRHAWDLVRQGEAQFDATLLHMSRGKGSQLSALGEKLVWADRRIAARLTPVLDSLAGELAAEIARVVEREPIVLRLQASHGYAVELLCQQLLAQGLALEHRWESSTAAVAALRDRACDLAGLHLPLGPLAEGARAHYERWLDMEGDGDWQLIDVAVRRQGLMVAPGNPKKLYELADLTRADVRFIGRQAGSGTRRLLEWLLQAQGLASERIAGFEQGEFTHAAVAAYVASGMADAGFGLETPARRFGLDFVPLASERYFLLCRAQALALPAVQTVLALLRSEPFRAAVDALPGYHATDTGRVQPWREVLAG